MYNSVVGGYVCVGMKWESVLCSLLLAKRKLELEEDGANSPTLLGKLIIYQNRERSVSRLCEIYRRTKRNPRWFYWLRNAPRLENFRRGCGVGDKALEILA